MAHTQHYSSNYISFSSVTLRVVTELDENETITIRLVADDSMHDEDNILSSYTCQSIHLSLSQARELYESLSATLPAVEEVSA